MTGAHPDVPALGVFVGGGAQQALEQLTAIQQSVRAGGSVPVVALPDFDSLDELDEVNEELLVRLFDLLYTHPLLDPDPTPEQVRELVLNASLRFGGSGAAHHFALLLDTRAEPVEETRQTLFALRMRGVHDERETRAAQHLVSCLLDHPRLRSVTVDELSRMADYEGLRPVVEYVRPQLTGPELARLDGR